MTGKPGDHDPLEQVVDKVLPVRGLVDQGVPSEMQDILVVLSRKEEETVRRDRVPIDRGLSQDLLFCLRELSQHLLLKVFFKITGIDPGSGCFNELHGKGMSPRQPEYLLRVLG